MALNLAKKPTTNDDICLNYIISKLMNLLKINSYVWLIHS